MIQKLFGKEIKQEAILGAATSKRSIKEIEDIIRVCKREDVPITSSAFKQTPMDVETDIFIC